MVLKCCLHSTSLGTDEDEVIRQLTTHVYEQRHRIQQAYKIKYGDVRIIREYWMGNCCIPYFTEEQNYWARQI